MYMEPPNDLRSDYDRFLPNSPDRDSSMITIVYTREIKFPLDVCNDICLIHSKEQLFRLPTVGKSLYPLLSMMSLQLSVHAKRVGVAF